MLFVLRWDLQAMGADVGFSAMCCYLLSVMYNTREKREDEVPFIIMKSFPFLV
jgi:hypothetical protein